MDREIGDTGTTFDGSWLEDVFDSLDEGILVCDGEGRILAANPSAQRILGLDLERARGRDIRELPWRAVHPDGSPMTIDEHPILETLETRTPVVRMLGGFLRRPGDEPRWLRVNTRLVASENNGRNPDVVASFSDVSEHLRTERRLQERIAFDDLIMRISARFMASDPADADALIEQALAEIGVLAGVDRAYVFLFRGDRSRADSTHEWAATGVSEEKANLEVLPVDGFHWLMERLQRREVIHLPRVDDLPAEATTEREEFARAGIRSILIVPMTLQGGLAGFIGFVADRDEKRWNPAEIGALQLATGIFASALSRLRAHRALQLVTAELRRHTLDLEKANRDLREEGDMKSEFVAMTSHELRAPLTTILGFTESLRERGDHLTAEQHDRFLEGIDRQSRRLFRLVDDLMVASRLDTGSLGAVPEDVRMKRVVTEAIETLGSGGTVTVDVPEDLMAHVDPDHARRIVVNLVRNAQKYGNPPITVSARTDGDQIELAVSDEGPGVSPDFEERLFQKFERADVRQSREQGGTGLGLAIVRGLAEVNGGSVAYSPLRPEVPWRGPDHDGELRGARFAVRLPKA